MDKNKIRKELLSKRNSLEKNYIKDKSNIAVQKIKDHNLYQKAHTVALFNAFGSEINLSELLKDKNKQFLLPAIKNSQIVFIKINEETKYIKSSFNILEPIGEVYGQQIDFMVVPLLGVNSNNYRIGYGKGYYDKYLFVNRPKHTISFALNFQKVEFSNDKFDEKIDEIIFI